MLSGEVADLNETGSSRMTNACDNRLKPYRTGGLLIRAERRRGGAASAGGEETVAEAVLSGSSSISSWLFSVFSDSFDEFEGSLMLFYTFSTRPPPVSATLLSEGFSTLRESAVS